MERIFARDQDIARFNIPVHNLVPGLTDPKEELTGNPLTKGCSGLLESQGERTQEPPILTIEAGSHFQISW